MVNLILVWFVGFHLLFLLIWFVLGLVLIALLNILCFCCLFVWFCVCFSWLLVCFLVRSLSFASCLQVACFYFRGGWWFGLLFYGDALWFICIVYCWVSWFYLLLLGLLLAANCVDLLLVIVLIVVWFDFGCFLWGVLYLLCFLLIWWFCV